VKPLSADTLLGRGLTRLTQAICRRPGWFIWPQALLLLVCVLYTVRCLQFNTDRSQLVGKNEKYHRNFMRLKAEFPQPETLVVLVESEDTEKNRQFVERLGARLEAETNLFADVFYRPDLRTLGSKALMFVPEADLGKLREKLKNYHPFIEQFTQATNLVTLFDRVNKQILTARKRTKEENRSMVDSLPALERILTQAESTLERPGKPPSPGLNALFNAGPEAERQIYITFGNGSIFLVTSHARTAELNNQAVPRLRELIEATRLEVPGVNVGLTGEPVLDLDELRQSQQDTTLASVVSFVICALIFIYGYHETGRPIKATICLVVGLGYTLGFATLAVGHLNILTITFLPMLIGLAIDFGVHLVTRYEEELRHGRTETEALMKAMVFTGKGIFTGALTTAAGFLAMGFTHFKGIQEMGIICGGGLLICLVPMMTLLPALLLRGRQNVLDHELHAPDHRARIEKWWLDRPWTTMGLCLGLCAVALAFAGRLFFDYNLLHLQSHNLPAVQAEEKLIETASKSVIFGAVLATNLDQAVELEEKLKKLPAVSGVDSMASFLRENSPSKLEMIRGIQQDLAGLEFAPADTAPVNLQELSRTLYYLYGYLGNAVEEVSKTGDEPELLARLRSLRRVIEQFRRDILAGNARQLEAKAQHLALFQQAFFADIRETFHTLQTQDTRERLRPQDLPSALRNRFVGQSGCYLLQVYPKKDIWQRENQRELIEQMRSIDPDATGTPVQLYEYTNLLKNSYVEAAWYSLAAISLMVLIHFRNPLFVLLALLPVGMGTLWLVGLMGWLDIPFNPANIMTLPLVIGIGVTNGVHILNRFAEEQNPGILAKSTGKAVLVSGLTTLAGFGSLVLAKHQGIESLGYMMALGTAACMIAALTFLPALLHLLMRRFRLIKQPSAAT
jgi:hopanoid biosynthesis associated RND transporter like protein HpnN